MTVFTSFTRTVLAAAGAVAVALGVEAAPPQGFDHAYGTYATILASHVRDGRVDYRGLAADRAALVAVTSAFGAVDGEAERAWTREERLAFSINAYNLFTLQAIVDHYPIRQAGLAESAEQHPSDRRRMGSADTGAWRDARSRSTISSIGSSARVQGAAHPLRRELRVDRLPPLRSEPYRASSLGAQLDANARSFLASPQGLRVDAGALVVTSILKWYGDDFVDRFGADPPAGRTPTQAAILRVVEAFGPPAAASLARNPAVRIRFLDYDWTLNDVVRPR